ncbi:kinase-like domain-containing protein [Chlamydoabsidia padenii]|nr:kinase-like domain-containing protein [Chlamydoabsidia padenii]
MKLAERYTDGRKYAVKIIAKDKPSEREQRTRREMTIMHLLQHPNICRLEDWACEQNEYYLFLEYVDGGQLLDYIIRHGKLKEKQARKFARQIVSALDYCHRNAIVHRDLKIENILITRDENIKIIDFGLSNFYSTHSLLNTFCGSLYFAAPELLRAHDYIGPEVDVWSFGVVLFVLVSGRVPFDDTSLPVLHQKIKAGVVDYPEHLTKDCVDLLSNILQVDPKRRGTLAFVREHPWMNKGYHTSISNHLLPRYPLDTIDKEIVQQMYDYGFGTPEEIHTRLQTTIQQRDTIDDPIVSVYYLVKERQLNRQVYDNDQWHTSLNRSKTDLQHHRSNSLLQRSKSAAKKRLSTIFQQQGDPTTTSTLSRTQSMRDHIRRIHSFRSRKDSPTEQHPMEDQLVKRLLLAAENTSVQIENQTPPNFSAHPKSLFRFHHRHLFRVSPPYLMQHLLKLLDLMEVKTTLLVEEPYSMQCQVSDWKTLTGHDMDASSLFTLMIYQARWAGGRLGIKLNEAEDEHGDVFKSLYFMILRCIGSFIDQHVE